MRRLVQIGREDKLERIIGYIMAENVDMQRLCQNLGFRLEHSVGDPAVTATLDLRDELPAGTVQSPRVLGEFN